MSLAFPSPEFDDAVAAACHGLATEDQARALNKLLRSQPAARDAYILRLELHSRLASDRDLFAGDAVGATEPRTNASQRPPASRVQRAAWAVTLAASVALLAAGGWWVHGRKSGSLPGQRSSAIAMLNRVVEAGWQQPGDAPRLGAPLEPGWLRLTSGLAQIVFYSGARLVMEGPAELRLVSPGEVVCLGGRLVAEVPPPAKGFRVRTPSMDIMDPGTVFGVSVMPSRTELHAFKGEVEFQTSFNSTRQHLPEGQGAIADGAAPARLVPANRAGFASLFDLHIRSSEVEVLRHETWRAASARLKRDPSLLVHFDFEPGGLPDWRLPNSSQSHGVTPDATVVGCQWTEGRWADKRALEFRSVSDRVRLEVPGEYEALTLATWVRVQGLDRQINSLFMSDGFGAGTVHWSIRHDGVLALTAIGAEPRDHQICISPPALALHQFGLWTHLAVVIDGRNQRVAHYLDGVALSEHTLKIAPPFRIGVAELGNWNAQGFPRNDPFMIRAFSGAMDEFCLFSRALSSGEIRALYSAGQPQPDSSRQSRN